MNNFIRITELNEWDVTSAFSTRFSKSIFTPNVLKPFSSAAKLIFLAKNFPLRLFGFAANLWPDIFLSFSSEIDRP